MPFGTLGVASQDKSLVVRVQATRDLVRGWSWFAERGLRLVVSVSLLKMGLSKVFLGYLRQLGRKGFSLRKAFFFLG